MKVRVYPADAGACGWYRIRSPYTTLADRLDGWDITQGHRINIIGRRQANGLEIPVGIDLHPDDHNTDVMVFQRVVTRELADLIPLLQAQGIAVIVETDDDLHSLPKGHPYRRDTSIVGSGDGTRSRRWLRVACERADLVTCTTPALAARYAPHGRAAVLPNYLPDQWLDHKPRRLAGPPIYGWTGSVATHVGDLEVTGGAIARVLDEVPGSRFRVVGTGVGVPNALGLGDRPITADGWVPLDAYPDHYRQLDIAIVPLELNAFNEAKSWLKGLEAAALGVPFVASPTGPYQDLHRLGAGLLAATPADWQAHLTALADPGYHATVAALGRRAAEGLTIGRNWWRWQHAIQTAAANRRNHTRSNAA